MADFVVRLVAHNAGVCMNPNLKFQGMCVVPCCTPILTYHMKNFSNFTFDLDSPVHQISLPQEEAECAITLKVCGNIETANISWTIVDEPPCTTVVDELDGMCGRAGPVRTVCDQLDFLFNTFENKAIEYEYDMYVGCSDINDGNTPPLTKAQAQTAFNNSSLFRRHVKITKINVNKTEQTPVTYKGTMVMVIGVPETTVSESST